MNDYEGLEVHFDTITPMPPGKLANAEVRFIDGPLVGLKIVGIKVWGYKHGNGQTVYTPSYITPSEFTESDRKSLQRFKNWISLKYQEWAKEQNK